MAAAITPITGMLRRRLVLDLSIGFGIGFAMANWYWYGYHLPRTNARDNFYAKLEAKRAEEAKE